MRTFTTISTGVLCACLGTAAFGAGFDLGERVIDPLFEGGNYLEVTTYRVKTSVNATAAGLPTGDVSDDFFTGSFAIKQDLSDKWSYAIIADHPFARDLTYSAGPFARTEAHLDGYALTGYLRYKFNDRFSTHFGLRAQRLGGFIADPVNGTVTFDNEWAAGYSLGVAYEIPEIALRASLTYDSAIKSDHDTRFNDVSIPGLDTTSTRTPQTVNLKFQTGVREDTLVFGAVRWTDWDNTKLDPGNSGGPNLFGFRDGISVSIGVARQFNEQWTGFAAYEWERGEGTPLDSPLEVDDNSQSLSIGAQYKVNDATITGVISYIDVRDRVGAIGGASVSFESNSAVALGVKVGWNF